MTSASAVRNRTGTAAGTSFPGAVDAETFSPGNRRRLSAPGLRTFVATASLWGLSEKQRLLVLGLPSRSTYYGWIKAAEAHEELTLPLDVLLRISAVLGIHKALGILFADEREGVAWLHAPHASVVFGGRPPLAALASGTQDGLMTVRRFLDAARGGLYMEPNAADRDFRPYTDSDLIFA